MKAKKEGNKQSYEDPAYIMLHDVMSHKMVSLMVSALRTANLPENI
jgi:hypothetical protein